ncbi:jg16541 [Pararge aegeria aegeria]|uniref:Jg16541 protein n=1 Tax=Pararge aegeria aegeria TaxID=348720 RepID=A0A8S4SRC2_9NEOP|nr:jg16541 [Pararge aegeria aegeria]
MFGSAYQNGASKAPMAPKMDLAFYFHRGRHDFSTMHGENMALSPHNRISPGSAGVTRADIIKLLLFLSRETSIASSLMKQHQEKPIPFQCWTKGFSQREGLSGITTLGTSLQLLP